MRDARDEADDEPPAPRAPRGVARVVSPTHAVPAGRGSDAQRSPADRELVEEITQLRTFVAASPVGMAYLDTDLRYREVNPALAAMNGRSPQEHIGRTMAEVVPQVEGPLIDSAVEVLRTGAPVSDVELSGTTRRARDEKHQWVAGFFPVSHPDGSIAGVGVTVREVTQERRTQRQLVERATRDPLTGLANRELFTDRLRHALSRRRSRPLVVLFVDLDRFKVVNDSLGHAAGDRLLRAVAAAFETVVRSGDTVARLGGDEFGVLCEEVDSEREALQLGERLHRALAGPLLTNPPLHVECSIGIALAEPGHDDAEALLRDADTAVHRAKTDGRGRSWVFDATLRQRAVARLTLERRLRTALSEQVIEVHYQPVVDLRSGRMVGVEALARWPDAGGGAVPPDVFIPVAEDCGLIHDLGAFVLRTACTQARQWAPALAGTGPVVAVNVSPQQLLHGSRLVSEVESALHASGLAPSQLCLEITESSVVTETDAGVRAIDELVELGVTLAVDDFGTGYSSLSYLTRLPISIVKADRSFVAQLSPGGRGGHIVRAVIGLARGLGLGTVAEGVEHVEQAVELRRLGCDVAQGFLFSRAVPASRIPPLLTRDFLTGRTAAAEGDTAPRG